MFIKAKNLRNLGAGALVLAALSACQTTGVTQQAEGIGYREARFAEVAAVREWRACRDDAVALDEQARKTGDSAKYLASARLLVKCEADIGSDGAPVAKSERFPAYALSVQNHLKAGDITAARQGLEKLKGGFPDQDLYLANGASFIEGMEVLLGLKSRAAIGEFAMTNIPGELKSELRRAHYWKRH